MNISSHAQISDLSITNAATHDEVYPQEKQHHNQHLATIRTVEE